LRRAVSGGGTAAKEWMHPERLVCALQAPCGPLRQFLRKMASPALSPAALAAKRLKLPPRLLPLPQQLKSQCETVEGRREREQ